MQNDLMQNMMDIQERALQQIAAATDYSVLESIRIEYLGKKGVLTQYLKELAHIPATDKPGVGQLLNQIKQALIIGIEEKRAALKNLELETKLATEQIDVTLSGRHTHIGTIHPVNQIKDQIVLFFSNLGFNIVDGPEIETDFYNFAALNIPKSHPARAMHDTFYFGDGSLLRTHTSPVQIRTLEKSVPPVRLISSGRVYRCDSDATHTPMFHQVEGLMIDKQTNMAQLRGILHDFFINILGYQVKIRFRPSYFPFTEPSAEIDISCSQCNGDGCRICKMTGWLEVGGCGMVHPNVLKAVDTSSIDYQGWAFGIGIDRLAMLVYAIDDLRLLFENDLDFLQQF